MILDPPVAPTGSDHTAQKLRVHFPSICLFRHLKILRSPHEATTYPTAKPFVPASPAVFTREQIKQAAAERAILDATDSQANYYAKVVLEFAQKHPDDPRVPESLSRAVKNTDRNCNNARTSALSKKAFTLLNTKYPNTSW